MVTLRSVWVLCLLLAFTVGCSFDWERYEPTGVQVFDAGDLGGIDAPSIDAVNGCRSDNDCASNPLGSRRCDTNTGRCVECVPASDSCPQGQYCTQSNTCAVGCRDDATCRAAGMTVDGGADAGSVSASRCDPVSRGCVQCLSDEHCPIGQRCAGMVCVAGCDARRGCPSGEACCNGACIDPNGSAQNCGGCGRACSTVNGAPACQNGVCVVGVCTAPFGDCDHDPANGCETNTRGAAAHCGGCGMACAARANATVDCVDGACTFTCRAGYGDCDGDPANGCEIDLSRTLSHCGRCETVCDFPGGSGVCAGGMCSRTACEVGRADCDGNTANGCETDLDSDVANCRMCGRACMLAHAVPECVSGGCQVMSCETGYADCDLTHADGCEVNLRTDAMNCGACGRTCAFPRGVSQCVAGACALASCETGFGNCDNNPVNGCETDTNTAVAHCGSCGTVCPVRPHARPSCVSARCGVVCDTGWADCDGNPDNGCEVNTASDPTHCGGCGTQCSFPNATAVCRAGVCAVGTCSPGYGDCNGATADGCEASTSTDMNNCGACGRPCTIANGSGACVASVCTVTTCSGAYNNCDGNSANGCEANLALDMANCGTCGTVCSGGTSCSLGRCAGAFAGYGVTTPPAQVAWVDACVQPGALVGLRNADDEFAFAPLSVPVSFWGARDTTLFIQSNGIVSFGPVISNAGAIPGVLPIGSYGTLPTTMGVTPAVYAMGVDLVQGPQGMCIATLGSAPNRSVVIETVSARLYAGGAGAGTSVSFEVIAYESNANIDVLYSPTDFILPTGVTLRSPEYVTVGLQDFRAPLRGVNYTGEIRAGTRIRFTPL